MAKVIMTNPKLAGGSVIAVIAIVGILINLPVLQLDIKNFGETGEIPVWPSKVSPIVWNRGAELVGGSIFAPWTCISIQIDENISCHHETMQNSQSSCENPICDSVPKGNFLTQDFILNLETKPDSFDFDVLLNNKVQLGYFCELNDKESKYNCKKKEG
jgi:hypothetical protein